MFTILTRMYDERFIPYCKGLVNQIFDKKSQTPPTEPACCKALTKECLACSKGVSEDDFCDKNQGKFGCPEEPFKADCNNWPCAASYSKDNITTVDDFYDKCTSIGGKVFKHGDTTETGLSKYETGYINDLKCTKSLPNHVGSLQCTFWNRSVEDCVLASSRR